MSPRDVYDRYTHGAKISDENLIEAVFYFKEVADLLVKAGPVFKLAFVESNRIYLALEDMAIARGFTIDHATKSATSNKSNIAVKPTISWGNTLRPDYARFGWMLTFRDHAITLGYPYFAWSGRVYETKSGQDTGIFSADLK